MTGGSDSGDFVGDQHGRLVQWAYGLAESLLAEPLPTRWAHSKAVFAEAVRVAPSLGDDAELVAAAAILHDVGYRQDAVRTGQHMIDGAVYLRDVIGADARICRLVAHHTSSAWEAHELGLDASLAEFPREAPELAEALTYCDLRGGPTGELVEPAKRLAEVLERYGPDHVVFRAVSAARPELLAMCERVEQRLATATSG